jgi:hypothetical protein
MVALGIQRTFFCASTAVRWMTIQNMSSSALSSNKQFEPTVTRRHMRAASAPLHYALAARKTPGRAAAQLRR